MAPEEETLAQEEQTDDSPNNESPPDSGETEADQDQIAKEWEEQLAGSESEEDAQDAQAAPPPPAPAAAPTGTENLDFFLDLPLLVTVELGRNKMAIHDLLRLGQGSVIELGKLVGEPLEILVNDRLIARGEPVVVNEKIGIRLTDIVSAMERVENLG